MTQAYAFQPNFCPAGTIAAPGRPAPRSGRLSARAAMLLGNPRYRFPTGAARATVEAMATLDITAEDTLQREEEKLARSAAAGDGQAFATLYERYESRAYNLAYRVTGSAEDAADATQD